MNEEILDHRQDIGHRVGAFSLASLWNENAVEKLNTVVRKYYGDNYINPTKISDIPAMAELRQEVRRAAPAIARLADETKSRLESSHSALIIEDLGLAPFDLDTKRRLLYCFCLGVGNPTPTDKYNRQIIWDVKARDVPKGQVSTFSENHHEAKLHTDTQYFPEPERYALLYVVNPATEGGISIIRDGKQIKEALLKENDGAWALDILTHQRLPFRIPTSYTSERKQDVVEVTYAPIFSDTPLIRYRKDTLEAGLAAFKEHDTADIRRALEIFERVIEDENDLTVVSLKSDSVLITNNHEGLHGRTEFKDLERHLIRIRIGE